MNLKKFHTASWITALVLMFAQPVPAQDRFIDDFEDGEVFDDDPVACAINGDLLVEIGVPDLITFIEFEPLEGKRVLIAERSHRLRGALILASKQGHLCIPCTEACIHCTAAGRSRNQRLRSGQKDARCGWPAPCNSRRT